MAVVILTGSSLIGFDGDVVNFWLDSFVVQAGAAAVFGTESDLVDGVTLLEIGSCWRATAGALFIALGSIACQVCGSQFIDPAAARCLMI